VGGDAIDSREDRLHDGEAAFVVKNAEATADPRRNTALADRERVKQLERENAELKRANEILRKASAFFAQAELDRRGK